jgi:hypothetical protein
MPPKISITFAKFHAFAPPVNAFLFIYWPSYPSASTPPATERVASKPADKPKNKKYQCDDQQQVDEAAAEMIRVAAQPAENEYENYYIEYCHIFPLVG